MCSSDLNYTPVLVESPALPPPSTLGSRTFLFAVDDAQAWQSFEQSGALQGLKYSVVVPQGIGIPGAHQIDVSTEESLKDGLARLKSVAADTIVAIKQLANHREDELMLGDFLQQRGLLDLLFAIARDRYEAIGHRQVALATLCLGAVRSGGLNAYTGLFAGFMKSTARELPVANCKAVATDEAQLTQGLSRVVSELEAGDRIAEVAYSGGTRRRFILGKRDRKSTRLNSSH